MKLKHILFVATALFLFTSCGDDCEAETLEEIIVGEWTITALGNSSTVEFKSNGTFTDSDDFLIGGSVGSSELAEKTYEVNSDDSIEVTASDGGSFFSTTYNVTSFECDEVVLNIIGISATMKRK